MDRPGAEGDGALTDTGLPVALADYLRIWCADLLAPLTARQRDDVLTAIHDSYGNRPPWPPRLLVQRIAELSAGVIDAESFAGEITARYGYGLRDTIGQLDSPDPAQRATALQLLCRYPHTTELIAAMSCARRAGALNDAEFRHVCGQALRQPVLPDPIPLPPHC